MPLLNGEHVKNEDINPQRHRFIGLFRYPSFPVSDGTWDVWGCSCGQFLQTFQELQEHWMLGHMDIPQYVDIQDAFSPNPFDSRLGDFLPELPVGGIGESG